ncbi:RagB/SusD family nutrient uptake outer membrane protein [Panacibacter ginsenosidivorans]|uniref:RagB/SusD family nutrient uptake outer membrane protein n=1 Tax=Panacibacter ginsenosidivorans TaxID=1813871 RepID=A0A5B8V5L1_9BACT|nr:RagB/SusD family nutrient uptake outer membrane protein [Panacibacter ginsenosidivorans]QEC66103.1 RagB/SusD family nutrient uptake outer membrane protein [Panacibacter ginsenosidivorans]
MKGIKYILLFAMINITATSCKKILDITSPNEVGDNTIFTSVDGLRNARIGMYNTLQDRNYYGGYFPLFTECYTDNGTTGGYDVIDLNDIAARTVGTSNIYVEQSYNAIYNTIYTANKIINNIDAVPNLDPDEHDNTLAEALFVRALAEFDLLRTWGEHWDKNSQYGISIVTTNDAPQQPVARSTVEESYQQIIADLQQADGLFNNYQGNQYSSLSAAKALLARVYLYHGDMTEAADMATAVIDDANFGLLGPDDFTKIYTQKLTEESVFELVFDPQNISAYNAATYLRDDALRSDVIFIANADLNTFFESRPDDKRSQLVDFVNNDVSIEPDGRTQKYRGETTKENSAYIIRLAEMYLIRAEASGMEEGLADLNAVRTARGMEELSSSDFETEGDYITAILDERRAELNFEGQRLSDLARLGKVEEYLGEGVNPIMPIPARETSATNDVVVQNPGY